MPLPPPQPLLGAVYRRKRVAAPAQPHFTHLFEAEGHGEHADPDDAVHHVHDETRVGRRHSEAAEGRSSVGKKYQTRSQKLMKG